ncbi:unnamed protein product, partial [Heterosigma akashiwo]
VEHGVYVVPALDPLRPPPGEGYVQFADRDAAERARMALDRQSLFGRYLELFLVTRGDLYAGTTFSPVLSMQGPNAIYDIKGMTCVKMIGLPPTVDEDMIFKFFAGVKVIGIFICRDPSGNITGEGFAEFENLTEAQRGSSRNKAQMEDRAVTLLPCAKDDVVREISDPHGRPRRGGYADQARGYGGYGMPGG